jgi:GntR family transcriptional regulator
MSASRVDPTSDQPLFRQIASVLRERIMSGELEPGAQLPSETDLRAQFSTSRPTVRQAVALLTTEGLVQSEHGRGTFVRRRPPVRRLSADRLSRSRRASGQAAFLADAAAAGARPDVDMIEVSQSAADDQVAEWLELEADAPVLVRSRRYLADGQPMQVATSYLPGDLAETIPALAAKNPGPGGIYARIEDAGHVFEPFRELITVRMPTEPERRTLGMPPATPVLDILRTARDNNGRVLEVCHAVLRGDRYAVEVALPAD